MSIGCRPVSDEEIEMIRVYFDDIINDTDKDKFDLFVRNKTIFFSGLYSGFRISELLSLTIGDIYKFGKIGDSVYLKRENSKGKTKGRTGMINDKFKTYLQ